VRGAKCRPIDTSGLPTPNEISCAGTRGSVSEDSNKTFRWLWMRTGSCSFRGTIYVLCDP
jgi:hypothetical protein